MSKSQHTEAQMIGALKQLEAGAGGAGFAVFETWDSTTPSLMTLREARGRRLRSPDGRYLAFGPLTTNANAWTIANFPGK